jgi:predicted ATPase
MEKTEGNPFFIEEMVQALFEDEVLRRNGAVKITRPLTQVRVPATVQAVLASRIDRLPAEEKDLLHTLAVLGREFPLSLVQQVASSPADELERFRGCRSANLSRSSLPFPRWSISSSTR